MSGRECTCGLVVPHGKPTGPVTKIDGLKFYDSNSLIGHPTSRQRVFLCPECTQAFIEFITMRRLDGPGSREVVE